MKKIRILYNYCIYRLKAVSEHGVHSPFVFDLVTNVIYNRADYYCFKNIETIREKLFHSQKVVSRIPKQHTNAAKYDQLLFRLVNYFQPSQILELGTSIGITSIYMASANSKTVLLTIEEDSEIAEVAKNNFKNLKLKNIEQLVENFDTVVPKILTKNITFNFIHFDENLSAQATLDYFNNCLSKADSTSVFVFDSIYRTSEMKEAWTKIKNTDQVTVTIDLFYLGIVFFRKEQVKQHFIIKF